VAALHNTHWERQKNNAGVCCKAGNLKMPVCLIAQPPAGSFQCHNYVMLKATTKNGSQKTRKYKAAGVLIMLAPCGTKPCPVAFLGDEQAIKIISVIKIIGIQCVANTLSLY
jgi:hypothetical protein